MLGSPNIFFSSKRHENHDSGTRTASVKDRQRNDTNSSDSVLRVGSESSEKLRQFETNNSKIVSNWPNCLGLTKRLARILAIPWHLCSQNILPAVPQKVKKHPSVKRSPPCLGHFGINLWSGAQGRLQTWPRTSYLPLFVTIFGNPNCFSGQH